MLSMDKGYYLKEIYRFQHGEEYFGLDVDNSLFFKMNKVTWDVIEVFPHYDKLTNLYDDHQIKEAADSLSKNKFITPGPQEQDTGQMTADPMPIMAVGLLLQDPDNGTLMPTQIIQHSINLLMRESEPNTGGRLILITDEIEKSLPTIEKAILYSREQGEKYNKKITITLNTTRFSLPEQCAHFIAANDLGLEIEITPASRHEDIYKVLSNDVARDLHQRMLPILKKTIVTLSLDTQTTQSLNEILKNLDKIGFLMVYLDFLCPRCPAKAKNPGIYSQPMTTAPSFLKQYLYDLSANKGKNSISVINIIPLIQTVMTSSKLRSGCSAGLNYIAVSPGGNIYPCHKTIARDSLKLGSIFDGLPRTRQAQLGLHRVENRETCRSCGVRYLCGGGPTLDFRSTPAMECEFQEEMAQNAMFLYQQLDLKEKSRIIGVANQMKEIMPYRCETTAPSKTMTDGTVRCLTVTGSSMRPVIKDGNRVVVQPLRPQAAEKIKIGDIVCFGKPATCHRVVRKYKKSNRWFVLEKGDNLVKGSVVPLEEISGKVISIQKGGRSFNLVNKKWAILNKIIATLSVLVHIGCVTFDRTGRRKN